MQVTLTQIELNEAVREWCIKRGIPVTENNKVVFTGYSGAGSVSDGWHFNADVEDIVVFASEGPYR